MLALIKIWGKFSLMQLVHKTVKEENVRNEINTYLSHSYGLWICMCFYFVVEAMMIC